jgi:hypothetical protein
MGVFVNDKIVAILWCIVKRMSGPALSCLGDVSLAMLVGVVQLSHLATWSEQKI